MKRPERRPGRQSGSETLELAGRGTELRTRMRAQRQQDRVASTPQPRPAAGESLQSAQANPPPRDHYVAPWQMGTAAARTATLGQRMAGGLGTPFAGPVQFWASVQDEGHVDQDSFGVTNKQAPHASG
ncbi:hypothetical protein ANO11243_015910 [Dothideomycetidae sp. 11243]|nr:hypothetical protein ANO11243_015910 [fungal sp. No.11243]